MFVEPVSQGAGLPVVEVSWAEGLQEVGGGS